MATGGSGGGGRGSVIATAVVVVKIDDSLFNRQLGQIRQKLQSLNMPNIKIGINANTMRSVLAQIQAIRNAASRPVNMNPVLGGAGAVGAAGFGGGGGLGRRGFNAAAMGMMAGGAGGFRAPRAPNMRAPRMGGGGGGGGMGGFGMSLAAGAAIGGAAALAGAPLREAIAMEASLAEVGRLAGYSKQQMAGLRGEFERISETLPGTDMDKLFGIAGFGARAGIGQGDPKALLEFTEAMAKIGLVVNDIPIEEFAEGMARIMNVAGVGSDQVEGLASGFAALDKVSTVLPGELLDMTNRLTGFGKAAGLTLPQVMALAATMRDVGLPVEAGSTAMIRIFTKLKTEGEEFAKVLNIDIGQFQAAQPLQQFQMVLEALAKIQDKTELINTIFAKEGGLGIHNSRDMAALTQMAGMIGQIQQRADMVAGEIVSKKTLEADVASKADLASKHLETLAQAMLNLAAALGDPFLPAVKDLSDAMKSAAQWIRGIMGPGKEEGQPGPAKTPQEAGAKAAIMGGLPGGVGMIPGLLEGGKKLAQPDSVLGSQIGGFFRGLVGMGPADPGLGAPGAPGAKGFKKFPPLFKKPADVPDILKAQPAAEAKAKAEGPNLANIQRGVGGLMGKAGKWMGFLGRGAGVLGEAVDAKGKLPAKSPLAANWKAMWDKDKIEGPFRAQTFEGGMDFGRSFQEGILSKEDTGKETNKLLTDIKKGMDDIRKDANKFLGIKNKMPALLD